MSKLPSVIVLSETRTGPAQTPSERDNQRMTDAAQLVGCRVYYIPSNFDDCENVENALWHTPVQEQLTPTVWIGFIPTRERYEEMYAAALAKNLRLLNTPKEHQDALEFAHSYPAIADLTPETVILNHPEEWESATRLGYPVFVRGSVRSRKGAGWTACVAENAVELEGIVNYLFATPYRSRGSVLVRRLVRLRHVRKTEGGFPVGREYRVFLYNAEPMGYGYYWEGDDALAMLEDEEEAAVLALAQEAARRLGAPFLCVDIGQVETGEWIVIEVGDANFAGYGQTPLLPLWQSIRQALVR
jgi:hypothetical protein